MHYLPRADLWQLRREWPLLLLLVGAVLLPALAYRLPRQATLSAAYPPAALPQQGFHRVEYLGEREQSLPFRWSEGEATLWLPSPGAGPLLLRALIAAPPAGRAAPLRLNSRAQSLPPFTVTSELRFYHLLLAPEPTYERLRLGLETNSFKEDLGRHKERRLGVIITTLQLRSPQGAFPPIALLWALLAAGTSGYALLRFAGWRPLTAALTLLTLLAILVLIQAGWAWQWALTGRLLAALVLATVGALAADLLLRTRWNRQAADSRQQPSFLTSAAADKNTLSALGSRLSAANVTRTAAPGNTLSAIGYRLSAIVSPVGLLVLVGALAVRIPWIAAPDPVGDLELSARRTLLLAEHGLAAAFVGGGDYLPLRLYLLLGMGSFAAAQNLSLASPLLPASSLLMKLPWLLADLALVAIIFGYARRYLSLSRSAGLALLYALMPQIWLNPAWWGQIDALLVLLLVLAVLSLGREVPLWSWGFLALALLVKMQAIMLLPLIGIVTLRRWGVGGLVSAGGLAVVLFGLGLAPLILAGQTPDLIEAYLGSVGRFNGVGINAWNIWYFVAPAVYLPDTDVWALGLSYRQTGMLLLGATSLVIGLLAIRRDDPNLWLEAAALQALAFFLLPTQIHERYLYLCFAFLALRIPTAPRLLLPFLVLSLSASLNIFATLDFWPALRAWIAAAWLGQTFAVINLALFAGMFWHFAVAAGVERLRRRVAAPPTSSAAP